MSAYVKKIASCWRIFAEKEPRIAENFRANALVFCEAMTDEGRQDQIEKMRASPGFLEFRDEILARKVELGIAEGGDREIALWIRTICFCDTMRTEQHGH